MSAAVPSAVPASPYLTAEEAAAYLRYPTAHAFRRSVQKFGIPHMRRGRQLFFTRPALDEFMRVVTQATAASRRGGRRPLPWTK